MTDYDERPVEQLLDFNDAADYLGIPARVLKNQTKQGTGPGFIRPSPRLTYFRREDLDAWKAGWQRG